MRQPGATKAADNEAHEVQTPEFLKRLGWDPESLRVGQDFNRWKIVPAATINHLCLGSVYAWSVFNAPLMRLNGVVAPSAADWTLGNITPTFSLVMGGFASGIVLGKYLDAYGPRACCLAGATCLAGGFSIASLAVATQNLPLLYCGGAVWGLANGFAYVPPISTLIRFFPESKGTASGLTLLGFGGGAIVAAPLFGKMIEYFRVLPEYVGPAADLNFISEEGKLFVEKGNELKEIVVATAQDLSSCGILDAQAGAYVVGTGSTGIEETFLAFGIGYGALMATMAFVFRIPPDNYTPPGHKAALDASSVASAAPAADVKPKKAAATAAAPLTTHHVSVTDATRSPQFWLLYLGFGSSIIGTYGLLSSGSLIMTEAFGSSLPSIVTAGFTSSYVAAMSAANLSGRIVFPAISDSVARWRGDDPFYARKYTQTFLWGISPALYLSIVWSIHKCVEEPSILPLAVFTGSSLGVLAVFGGSTANRPAIIGDLYGLKSMGTITARQLSVVLPSAYLGPKIVASFREDAIHDSIVELSSKVSDIAFQNAFGTTKASLPELIESKTVSISRLLELIPPEVQVTDPSPFVFDQAMLLMAGFQCFALATNVILKPVVGSNTVLSTEDKQ